MRFFCFLIFFIVYFSSFSQERSLLKGQILTPDAEASSINIINLTSKQGTTNSSEGLFEVEVSVNDTLLFSSVQYESREIIVTRKVLKKPFLTVLLVEKVDELSEVNISDITLAAILPQI
ncbi:hypothetical protein [Salinimicrobium sp. WS361]|uniref:hypothetical protein n=1 Tax=Salinimicrobium sp. WS361 TaxID=3425123 RepID=UPI003D6EE285